MWKDDLVGANPSLLLNQLNQLSFNIMIDTKFHTERLGNNYKANEAEEPVRPFGNTYYTQQSKDSLNIINRGSMVRATNHRLGWSVGRDTVMSPSRASHIAERKQLRFENRLGKW